MADSGITKRALAAALKELMDETPFEKIGIAQICDRCAMNRKSFYYHFRDKYDLVNWIFDTEITELAQKHNFDFSPCEPDPALPWEKIEVVCHYFYDNRTFYRRVLRIKGQNSFSDHFHTYLRPLFQTRFQRLLPLEDVPDMVIDFFTDGTICALERWLLDKHCLPPNDFLTSLQVLLRLILAGLKERLPADFDADCF